jgi:hypothetical protein
VSDGPENKHSWAKFRAPAAAPRAPQQRSAPARPGPRPPADSPAAPIPVSPPPETIAPPASDVAPPAAPPSPPEETAKQLATDVEVSNPSAVAASGEAATPHRSDFLEDFGLTTTKPVFTTAAPVEKDDAASSPATAAVGESGSASGSLPEPLADALTEFAERDLSPEARAERKRQRAERRGRQRPFWLWSSLLDSAQDSARRLRAALAGWKTWRKTASFQVLVAFVAIYAFLAVMRAPSDVVIEQSRHAEEMAFLQNFLKSYCAAGGPVLAERPHGGSELYPRGVVLEGEALDAFVRAKTGSTFVVHITGATGNPLAGFGGFSPVFAGGTYFQLEPKLNLALFRCTYLVRKDSEKAGALLMAKVELAN